MISNYRYVVVAVASPKSTHKTATAQRKERKNLIKIVIEFLFDDDIRDES